MLCCKAMNSFVGERSFGQPRLAAEAVDQGHCVILMWGQEEV